MIKSQRSMTDLWNDSYLSGENTYLDDLYESYLKDRETVPPEWRSYFDNLSEKTNRTLADISHEDIRKQFQAAARQPKHYSAAVPVSLEHEKKQEKVIELISAYRNLGHLHANIDPLNLRVPVKNPVLDLAYYGLTENDLNVTFDTGTFLGLRKNSATLKEIFEGLQATYCSTIGFEYNYITHFAETSWMQERIEQHWLNMKPGKDEQLQILTKLIAADGLEKYLGNKYVGQKRFSLEGGDALIPLIDTVISEGCKNGIKDIVIGMAHRGRLNVLANILGKDPSAIFAGFEGKNLDESTSGDVKYHMGYSSNIQTPVGAIHLSLAFNPSHLEIIAPVVQGSVRSRQRRRKDAECKLVMPVQIHGDAAFAGQGVVMETFSMSQTRWFKVGGSIHIVINNQVGFTISNPRDARSSLYCTDIAKMVDAPVLHVNANDPEAVVFAAKLAVDYRTKFKKDIVIDLVCYRRHGHNEADEPSATQPKMYQVIKSLPPACTLYAQKLLAAGVIEANTESQLAEQYRDLLDQRKSIVKTLGDESCYEYATAWQPFLGKDWRIPTDTGMPLKKLKTLGKQLSILPAGFQVQAQVKKTLETRQKMFEGEQPLNWGAAEALAFASLLEQGYPIRLCGQDACRGTFAHRHGVLFDQATDEVYVPLGHLSANQAHINLIDSFLSEEAVLAFEYGFASAEPNNLVIWEAQYGDFANGAQVVVDQFISSGEQKWKRLCGLVMLLPHGYEGAGPEHSSARLERYLQLCAQHNIQVCVPTTPAQIFHLLRRQMIRPFRKPLIVMSPKNLLRHPLAISALSELQEKTEYQVVIPEMDEINPKQVERIVLCSGKVYYDLLEKRRELALKHIAILRIEQLYPFPETELKNYLAAYTKAKTVIWCQEEPQNQGAWYAAEHHFRACLKPDQTLSYVGRAEQAAPAVGYLSVHLREQAELVKRALT